MSETATPQSQRMLAGRYKIGDLLGQGGMSTVFKGTDVKLGRQVAIKIMRPNLAGDEQFRMRFRQEAQSASRLAHPSVVRVLDAGDDLIQTPEGPLRLPFIVMEFVDGQNLREVISHERLTIPEACRVVDAVLSALEYSHRAGIVHRDIKPANIMITKSGQVKVMDFGIARAVSETSSTVQQTTAILGTAAYFSPEQAKGELVDARTDLYSTGVLLYELLAGSVPFRGDSAVAVAYQHVSERPKPPSELNSDISPALDRVVLHSLAKDRARRFQSASEFRDALRVAATGSMPVLEDELPQSSVLFTHEEEISESDLALRRLSETGASTRSQSRPPVLWVWASILTLATVVAAVVFWVVTMAPGSLIPTNTRIIPELINMEKEKAVETLLDLELIPIVEERASDEVEAGYVIETEPLTGERVEVDSRVTLWISIGPENPIVPEFTRMTIAEYTEELEGLGLTIGSITKVDDPNELANMVLEVSPAPGEKRGRGQTVDLTVSSGMLEIPDVKGQALEVARNTLSASGIRTVTPVPRTCALESGFPVVDQSVTGQQPQGTAVEIFYCQG